jgi:DNA-binding transcriptional ArsR family regulator
VSKRSSPKPEPAQPQPAHGKDADSYEAIFTALAHPARRLILMTLNFEGGEMTAGAIAAMFEHAWPTTTRHLRVLEAARLIAHQRRGRTRVYRLERRQLGLAHQWLAWFFKKPG